MQWSAIELFIVATIDTLHRHIASDYHIHHRHYHHHHHHHLKADPDSPQGDPDTAPQKYFTIMVERIPGHLRSAAALYKFFENLFPGTTKLLLYIYMCVCMCVRERAVGRCDVM